MDSYVAGSMAALCFAYILFRLNARRRGEQKAHEAVDSIERSLEPMRSMHDDAVRVVAAQREMLQKQADIIRQQSETLYWISADRPLSYNDIE